MAAPGLFAASAGFSLLDFAVNVYALEDQRQQLRRDVEFRQKEIDHAISLERRDADVRSRQRNATLQLAIGNADATFAASAVTGGRSLMLTRAGIGSTAMQNESMDRGRLAEEVRTMQLQRRFLGEKLASAEKNITLREIAGLIGLGKAVGSDTTALLAALEKPADAPVGGPAYFGAPSATASSTVVDDPSDPLQDTKVGGGFYSEYEATFNKPNPKKAQRY